MPASNFGTRPDAKRVKQQGLAILRIISRLVGYISAFGTLIVWFRNVCRRKPERRPRRPPSRADCQPVPSTIYRRPDPLIYDQYYLMGLGFPVTWDNPDIHIERAGVTVDPHNLAPNTDYEIVARVWNGSSTAPAVGLPVRFSYLSFGIGTQNNPLGSTPVDLGVKGSAASPAFARHHWRTPNAAGHYCLQVVLDWPDDANPLNNLGQTNIDVQSLNSPRATFRFPVRNDGRKRRQVRLRADGYALPARPACREERAASADITSEERERRLQEALGRHTGHDRLPAGWQVRIEPSELALAPGEEREVFVETLAPEGFVGRMGFNVNAFEGSVLLGGVTLYAQGKGGA